MRLLYLIDFNKILANIINTVKTKAVFKKIKNSQCDNRKYNLTDKFICGRSKNNISQSCKGDSGGSLMILRPVDRVDHYFITGVISSGFMCEKDIKFTIFTAVSPYLDWIIEKLY